MKNENKTSVKLRQKSKSSNFIRKQPNHSTCGCKVSKEFKDLPVISARRLRDMKVDINTTSKEVSLKSSVSKIPSAEKVVLSETQKTHTVVDDISSKEQKNFKLKFMNIYKKILNKIKYNIQKDSI